MNEISEIKQFTNKTNLRKVTQQFLKPIINEIEMQMQKIREESEKLKQQNSKIKVLEEKLQKYECKMKQQENISSKHAFEIQLLQKQNISIKKQVQKMENGFKDQVKKLKKEKQWQEELITKMKESNEKCSKTIERESKFIQNNVNNFEQRFQKLMKDTLQMTKDVKLSYEMSLIETKRVEARQERFQQENQNKQNVIKLYLSERQEYQSKFCQIFQFFHQYITHDQINLFKSSMNKNLQRIIDNVHQILEENLSVELRNLLNKLPHISKRVQFFEEYEERITNVQQNMIKINQNHNSKVQNLHEIFKQNLKHEEQLFGQIRDKEKCFQESIHKLQKIEDQFDAKLIKYGNTLKNQIELEAKRKSEELYTEIKGKFLDTNQKQRDKQMSQITIERQRFELMAIQIQSKCSKINQILLNYNNKITLVKSDIETFMDNIRKETTYLKNKIENVKLNFSEIGSIISKFFEIFFIQAALSLNDQVNLDTYAYTTENDGIILQKYIPQFLSRSSRSTNIMLGSQNHHKDNKESKGNTLLYRRKLMNTYEVKKSLMISLINYYEALSHNESIKNSLDLHIHKPSNFFVEYVSSNYQLQIEKIEKIIEEDDLNESHLHNLEEQFKLSKEMLKSNKISHPQKSIEENSLSLTMNQQRSNRIGQERCSTSFKETIASHNNLVNMSNHQTLFNTISDTYENKKKYQIKFKPQDRRRYEASNQRIFVPHHSARKVRNSINLI